MSDAATEAQHASFVDFPERSMTFRTGEHRRMTWAVARLDRQRHLPEVRLHRREISIGLHRVKLRCIFFDQRGEQHRDVAQRQDMVDGAGVDGAARHARSKGLVRILCDGNAAALFDREHARRPVVERAGQDHRDHPGSIRPRCRSEQRIHRRSNPIFRRRVHDANGAAFDDYVVIGRRDVDPAILQGLAISGVCGGQPAGAGEDFRQQASSARDVENDQDRSAEISRQICDHAAERFNATSGGPNDNDVVLGDATSPGPRCVHDLFRRRLRYTGGAAMRRIPQREWGGHVWRGRTP